MENGQEPKRKFIKTEIKSEVEESDGKTPTELPSSSSPKKNQSPSEVACVSCDAWFYAISAEYRTHFSCSVSHMYKTLNGNQCRDCLAKFPSAFIMIQHTNRCPVFFQRLDARETISVAFHRRLQMNIAALFSGDCRLCLDFIELFQRYHPFKLHSEIAAAPRPPPEKKYRKKEGSGKEHPEERIFRTCSRCQLFEHACSEFIAHCRAKHERQNRKFDHKCLNCDWWMLALRQHQEHVAASHQQVIDHLSCVICRISQNSANALRRHLFHTHRWFKKLPQGGE